MKMLWFSQALTFSAGINTISHAHAQPLAATRLLSHWSGCKMEEAKKIDADLIDEIAKRAAKRPPRLALTIDEAAESLGVSRRTIEGLINRGELEAKLIGRHLRISVERLRRLL
jgi:excisionase family DNA binding protein